MSNKKRLMVLFSVLSLSLAISMAATLKGSISVSLDRPVYVDGNPVKAGRCEIAFKSHSPEVDISFWSNGKHIEAKGKAIEEDDTAAYDQLVLAKDAEGRDVVKEIRLRGRKTAIVIE